MERLAFRSIMADYGSVYFKRFEGLEIIFVSILFHYDADDIRPYGFLRKIGNIKPFYSTCCLFVNEGYEKSC